MTKPELGEVVRKKRLSMNLTQKEVAEIIGVHANRVYEVEKGLINYKLDTLLKICAVLNVEVKIEEII